MIVFIREYSGSIPVGCIYHPGTVLVKRNQIGSPRSFSLRFDRPKVRIYRVLHIKGQSEGKHITGKEDHRPLSRKVAQSGAFLNRKALAMTETEEKLIARAAIMGESRIPKMGYRAPAATGTPRVL